MTSIRRGQDEWDGQVETPLGCQVVNWRRAITGRDQVGADVDGRDMTDREPVVVFRTQSTIEANVVRGLLEYHRVLGPRIQNRVVERAQHGVPTAKG